MTILSQLSSSLTLSNALNNVFYFLSEMNIFNKLTFCMERYSLFVLKVPLNTNQPFD